MKTRVLSLVGIAATLFVLPALANHSFPMGKSSEKTIPSPIERRRTA